MYVPLVEPTILERPPPFKCGDCGLPLPLLLLPTRSCVPTVSIPVGVLLPFRWSWWCRWSSAGDPGEAGECVTLLLS